MVSNVDTIATTASQIDARDDRGQLRLVARDIDVPIETGRDAETGGPSREWVTDRAVTGMLTVNYSVPARAMAPPFAFSDDGDATSAAGQVFLLMPPSAQHYRTAISWDLSALPTGARAVSSFGEGKVAPDEPLSSSELRTAFYMAGKIGTWPTPSPARGFFSA